MIQTLYGLIAIFIVAILMLTMNRSIHANETRMMENEVTAQVTPIATDIFDFIGNLPYDADVSSKVRVDDATSFQNPIAGSGFCDPADNFDDCIVMNDLHGKTIAREIHGLTYEIEVELEYLDNATPPAVSASPTFHKRARLTITSQDLTVSGTNLPLEVELTRRYHYPRATG